MRCMWSFAFIILVTILGLVWTLGNRWKNGKLIKLYNQLKSETPCWPLVGHAYKFIGNEEVLVLAFGNRWKNRKLIKLSEQLKSDTPCWPLVGHAYKFIGNKEDHMRAFTEHFGREAIKHGGRTSIWMGHMLFVVIADAADADFILKNYLEKGFVMNFVRDMIGNGNVVAPVPIWRPRRKILVRMLNNLEPFKNIFANNSSIMAERLESKVGTGPFPIWKYFSTYTMDTICEASLGEDFEKSQKKKIAIAIESGLKLAAERVVSPWQYNSTLFKMFPSYYTAENLKRFCDKFLGEKIAAKRKDLQNETNINGIDEEKDSKPKSFKSFMELLIESASGDKQYTDKEVQEEILVLFVAGSDTTAISSGFASVMLARHPDVQEKVYEELKEVFGDSTRRATPEDLTKLKFLDAVIKETLRLYSPVPVITRHSDRDLTLPSGVTIPSNCLLLVNIWALHRNPKYWGSDAEQFRPERWLDADFNLKHPAQYIPFSYGSRNCAGIKFAISSMKMMLSTMLRRYRILPDSGRTTDGVHKPLRLQYALIMKDSDNFIVSLEKRMLKL